MFTIHSAMRQAQLSLPARTDFGLTKAQFRNHKAELIGLIRTKCSALEKQLDTTFETFRADENKPGAFVEVTGDDGRLVVIFRDRKLMMDYLDIRHLQNDPVLMNGPARIGEEDFLIQGWELDIYRDEQTGDSVGIQLTTRHAIPFMATSKYSYDRINLRSMEAAPKNGAIICLRVARPSLTTGVYQVFARWVETPEVDEKPAFQGWQPVDDKTYPIESTDTPKSWRYLTPQEIAYLGLELK